MCLRQAHEGLSRGMARDPDITKPPIEPSTAEIGRPNAPVDEPAGTGVDREVDRKYWETCLADAERAEQTWRRRGREIVTIYRNEGPGTQSPKSARNAGGQHFNILFANTEVMLPAIYQKPPTPVVRSRFIQARKMVPVMPPPMMPPMGPMGGPPMAPPGGSLEPPGLSPGGPTQPPLEAPPGIGPPGLPAGPPPGEAPGGALPPEMMGMPPPPMMMEIPPPGPRTEDIDTAASVIEKALEIVVQDEASHEAIRTAIKDVLLPGRGICRVRWNPKLMDQPVPPPEPPPMPPPMEMAPPPIDIGAPPPIDLGAPPPMDLGGLPSMGPPPMGLEPPPMAPPPMMTAPIPPLGPPPMAPPPLGPPEMETVKIWETTNVEYVYWEDFLCDPVRQAVDMKWIAFRHLFTAKELIREFEGTPEFDRIIAAGKIDTLLKWTEESAAKSPPSGGSYTKSAANLGDAIKKAMVWEIWDRTDPADCRIIWFMRDSGGMDLRIDPDSLQLMGFFPVPQPMLSISTSDSRIPRPFYDLYARLAEDLETTSVRISNLTKQIKIRGAYNSASSDIAALLQADDQKMIPVDGVDMINGGLQNHIWMLPIDVWMQALDKLLMARESQKQSIYEIMGISDIMRGATKASETATAQRIKGSMGVVRLQDQKSAAANFARDLMRLQAEIIAQNFDAETLTKMTGEDVTPEVLDILRDDFTRTCAIDIESDSTVEVDEQTEQQSMAQIMQSIQAVMMGAGQMLATGVFPPPQVIQLSIELLRMFLHPVRNSRGVIELLDDFKEQLEASIAMSPPPMLGPPMGAPPGVGSPPGVGGESGGPVGAGPRPGTINQGQPGNGAAPPGM